MTILIMGAFNPPTIAHLQMGEVLHKEYPDANICYVVSNEEYIKSWKGYEDKDIIPFYKRVILLQGAIQENGAGFYAAASPFEGSLQSDGKTITTLKHFKEHIDNDVSLCIGSDNLKEFDKWYRCDDIVENARINVLCRGIKKEDGINFIPERFKDKVDKFHFIDFNYDTISSTKVREAFKRHELNKVKNDIPINVFRFLTEEYIKADIKEKSFIAPDGKECINTDTALDIIDRYSVLLPEVPERRSGTNMDDVVNQLCAFFKSLFKEVKEEDIER